jgi:PTB domain (IRS-1 type) protein
VLATCLERQCDFDRQILYSHLNHPAGAVFFECENKHSKRFPGQVTVGVNKAGIFVLNPRNKAVLEHVTFDIVSGWSPGPGVFSVQYGNLVRRMNLVLTTLQGPQVCGCDMLSYADISLLGLAGMGRLSYALIGRSRQSNLDAIRQERDCVW